MNVRNNYAIMHSAHTHTHTTFNNVIPYESLGIILRIGTNFVYIMFVLQTSGITQVRLHQAQLTVQSVD